MIDAELYFRETTDGNLTTDEAETTHIIDLGEQLVGMGTPLDRSMVLWIYVPTNPGSSAYITVTLYTDDTSTLASPKDWLVWTTLKDKLTLGGTGYYEIRFSSDYRYLGLKLDNSGSSSWGAVQAGVKIARSYSQKVQSV